MAIFRKMNTTVRCGATLAVAVLVVTAFAGLTLDVDLSAKPIRDMTKLPSAPVVGYAGVLYEHPQVWEDIYNTNRLATAQAFRQSGAWLLRQWDACMKWQRERQEDYRHQRLMFRFFKDFGIRHLVTLEQWGAIDPKTGRETHDIAVVRQSIVDYLTWIRANGWAETVAGFELGNETYFSKAPEDTAARWKEIIPAIRKAWPGAQIGIPLAEYQANDPDLIAVRNRGLAKEWETGGGLYKFTPHNQWSIRFVTALGPEALRDVTHVIYHFYGAETPYGCTHLGFERVRNFAKVCPELKDKHVWITEWRERSDEDNACWRMFFATLWRAHYLMTAVAHSEIDAMNLHCMDSIAFSMSPGRDWHCQLDGAMRFYRDWDKVGPVRFDRHSLGAFYRLMTMALKSHPVVLRHGATGGETEASFACCTRYYDSSVKYREAVNAGQEGAALPKLDGDVEYLVLADRPGSGATSLALVLVNTTDKPQKLSLSVKGKGLCNPDYRTLRCEPDLLFAHELPGEAKPWRELAWQDPVGAHPINSFDNKDYAPAKRTVSIAPNSFETVVVPLVPYRERKADK